MIECKWWTGDREGWWDIGSGGHDLCWKYTTLCEVWFFLETLESLLSIKCTDFLLTVLWYLWMNVDLNDEHNVLATLSCRGWGVCHSVCCVSSAWGLRCTAPALWPEHCRQTVAGAPGGLSRTTWGNLIAALGQRRSYLGSAAGDFTLTRWMVSDPQRTYGTSYHRDMLSLCMYAPRHAWKDPHFLFRSLVHPTTSQGFLRLRCPKEWPADEKDLL